eukprot:5801103-Pyramimonas_sp.AAC.1
MRPCVVLFGQRVLCSAFSLPRLCLEGFLLGVLKGSGQCSTPRAVPPVSAPGFPQLRPLSLALLISS